MGDGRQKALRGPESRQPPAGAPAGPRPPERHCQTPADLVKTLAATGAKASTMAENLTRQILKEHLAGGELELGWPIGRGSISRWSKYGLDLSRPGNGISDYDPTWNVAKPGPMIGVDSHSTLAGCIGMIAFGAGIGRRRYSRSPPAQLGRGTRAAGAIPDSVRARRRAASASPSKTPVMKAIREKKNP